jgi:hypothetical protein
VDGAYDRAVVGACVCVDVGSCERRATGSRAPVDDICSWCGHCELDPCRCRLPVHPPAHVMILLEPGNRILGETVAAQLKTPSVDTRQTTASALDPPGGTRRACTTTRTGGERRLDAGDGSTRRAYERTGCTRGGIRTHASDSTLARLPHVPHTRATRLPQPCNSTRVADHRVRSCLLFSSL